jgi:hypothetical protein
MAGLVGRESCLSRPGVRANQPRACAAGHRRRDNLPLRALWLRFMLKIGLSVAFRAAEPPGSCFRSESARADHDREELSFDFA